VSCGRFRTVTGRDQVDAEKLARYARLDLNILRPIAHRTVAQQEALTLIRARALLVRLRTAAVNAVRGLTKSCGYRMPASATTCFAQRSLSVMPPGLAQALGPVLQQIAEMTVKIKQYDRQIQQLGQTEYPETQALLKVHGVGHLTALTFVLTLGSKERFGRSRDVGCYLGLRPIASRLLSPALVEGLAESLRTAGSSSLQSTVVGFNSNIVETRFGKIQGYKSNGIHVFKGVHYGASTDGSNRFLPPVRPQPWNGIKTAVTWGYVSPQRIANSLGTGIQSFIFQASSSMQGEDCLCLNIWTPGLDLRKRPVMVWIHGGDFTYGSSQDPATDGENLSRRGNVGGCNSESPPRRRRFFGSFGIWRSFCQLWKHRNAGYRSSSGVG